MKIERIELRDFRGFPASYEIKLGRPGHNLLVYGENGSGKSSLFQALKRFFEASAKTDEITSHGNTFVDTPEPEVKLDIAGYDIDDKRLPESGIFEWSATSSPASQPLILQANKTKGCLDYRALLEIHHVHRDRDMVEIFDLLMHTVLSHVENPVTKKIFAEELEGIRKAPRQPKSAKGKEAYLKRIEHFNQGFVVTIEILTAKANELLREFFPDIEVCLNVRRKLDLSGIRKKYLHLPKVYVAATFCKHQTRLDLHHFFNEARLSALAISLFLASLLIVPAAKLPVLVLDDLLIGIDMSNRMAVLRILREHFKDWQIILMTHDRLWFESVRMSTLDEKTWWYSELYAEISPDGLPVPRWRGHDEGWTDDLERAKQHLAGHDVRAAGVYARAAFEGKLKKYCEKHRVAVQFKTNTSEMTTEMFWKAIKGKLIAEGGLAAVQTQISDIETYRKVVLNPLSHAHPTTLTEGEIKGAIDAIAGLDGVLK